ncbi:kinesin-like protein KIF3A isoform X2 [Clytia hemisphaerica]|uniref:Kinesin motor domain-containing protein n=1 Tax=Clytia hemisphaerica TaxID=252671 RepID=A0A7M5XI98_9CNID
MDGNEPGKNKKHKESQPEPIESTLWNVGCKTPDSPEEGGTGNEESDPPRTPISTENNDKSISGNSAQEELTDRNDSNTPKLAMETSDRSGLETLVDETNKTSSPQEKSQVNDGSEAAISNPLNIDDGSGSTREEDLQTPVNAEITPDVSQVDLTKVTTEANEDLEKGSSNKVWDNTNPEDEVDRDKTPINEPKSHQAENDHKNTPPESTTNNLQPNKDSNQISNGLPLPPLKPPASPFFLKQLDLTEDMITLRGPHESIPTSLPTSGKHQYHQKSKKTPVTSLECKLRGFSVGSSTSEKSEGSFSRVSSAGESPSTSTVKVVVRVRPFNTNEKTRNDKPIIEYPGEGGIWVDQGGNQPKPFTFNTVFEENCTQEKVFEECGIRDLIIKALDGFSCTAFAFGQTGSGKTHTILGDFEQGLCTSSGLVPRSIEYLFECICRSVIQYRIKASYLEVYNEKVKDLLNPSNTLDSLPIRWSTENGFYVDNLFSAECDSADDLLEILREGSGYRQMGGHAMNDHSSRSHCMLIINIHSEEEFTGDEEPGFPIIKHGKISFVDLAGSERVKETKTTGESLTESNNINKSLLTLGNCISALGDPRKKGSHIPYRESKLTKLLADSLGGDGYTLMIACISPSSHVTHDTLNTLRYANRAKNIKNKPVVKMDPREKLLQRLKRDMKLLKAENSYFRQQLGVPYSDSQIAMTPSQIHGDWTPEDGRELSPAIGSSTFSSLQSSRNNSSKDVLETITQPTKEESAILALNAKNGLYDILREFINENENLKSENMELHRSRAIAKRDQEEMSRENDRLARKLDNLGRVMLSTPRSHETIQHWLSTNDNSMSKENTKEHIDRNGATKEDVKFPPVQKGTHQNLIGQANVSPLKTNRAPAFSENGKVVESKIPLRERGKRKPVVKQRKRSEKQENQVEQTIQQQPQKDVQQKPQHLEDKSTHITDSLQNITTQTQRDHNGNTDVETVIEKEQDSYEDLTKEIKIDENAQQQNQQQQQQQPSQQPSQQSLSQTQTNNKNKKTNKYWRKKKPQTQEKPSGYAAQFAARKTKQLRTSTTLSEHHKPSEHSVHTPATTVPDDYMYNPYSLEQQMYNGGFGYDWNYNYAMNGINGQPPNTHPQQVGFPLQASYPAPVFGHGPPNGYVGNPTQPPPPRAAAVNKQPKRQDPSKRYR